MNFKKTLAAVLAAVSAVQCLPAAAFAEEIKPAAAPELPVSRKAVEATPISDDEIERIGDVIRNDYANSTEVNVTKNAIYNFSTDYYYNQLDADGKDLYDKLDAACQALIKNNVNLSEPYMCEAIEFSDTITNDELEQIYGAFYYSNPQYFFLANAYSYSYSGGIVIPHVIYGDVYDFMSDSVRDTYEKGIATVTDSWLKEINALSTDLEKETWIAEKLCDEITYTFTDYDQSIAGALVDKKCVCNGYAMALEYFCQAADIEAICVVSVPHAWNRVKIYGRWYEVDTTWMDNDLYDYVDYEWFNKSSSTFLANDQEDSHVIDAPYYDGTFTLPACTTDVIMPPVTAKAGDSTVTLSWEASPNADSYRVFSYANGKYTTIANTTATTYTVKGLTNGTKYGFLVRAYNGKSWSLYSTADVVYATPVALNKTPVIEKTLVSSGSVTISWTPVSGAAKYSVYTFLNGKYSLYKNTTLTSYTISGLTNGTKYGFLVRAYVNGKWTTFTANDRVYATPSDKPVVTAYAGNGKVTLTWDALKDASKYAVYLYQNGKYTLVRNTTAVSCPVTGLTNGTKYGFLVKAYVNGKWTSYTSADRLYATPVEKPVITKTVPADGRVRLYWSEVSGASKYAIYTYSNGKYTHYKNTTATAYTVSELTNSVEYGFLVRAYVNGQWTSYNIYDHANAVPKA